MKSEKRIALEQTIEIWTELASRGGGLNDKYDIADELDYSTCPICKYDTNRGGGDGDCRFCPLERTNICNTLYKKWLSAISISSSKHWAREILNGIKQAHAKLYKDSPYKH